MTSPSTSCGHVIVNPLPLPLDLIIAQAPRTLGRRRWFPNNYLDANLCVSLIASRCVGC